ncbi:SH3 domain-containing protein [Candidatus Omnitrophota bacterium]
MRFIKIFISATFLCISLQSVSFSGDDEGFPKIGFVKNNDANVRAGDNVNFESLCRLEKSDPVKITGSRYSWFKIALPKKARLFIKNDYVDLTSDEEIGIVNAARVNIRAGEGTKYSVVGQVSSPEKLNILEEIDGWYKIMPPEGSKGWMHSSQIEFSLRAIKYISAKKGTKAIKEEREGAQ